MREIVKWVVDVYTSVRSFIFGEKQKENEDFWISFPCGNEAQSAIINSNERNCEMGFQNS